MKFTLSPQPQDPIIVNKQKFYEKSHKEETIMWAMENRESFKFFYSQSIAIFLIYFISL